MAPDELVENERALRYERLSKNNAVKYRNLAEARLAAYENLRAAAEKHNAECETGSLQVAEALAALDRLDQGKP